jgi:hypothetical protein
MPQRSVNQARERHQRHMDILDYQVADSDDLFLVPNFVSDLEAAHLWEQVAGTRLWTKVRHELLTLCLRKSWTVSGSHSDECRGSTFLLLTYVRPRCCP